MTSSFLFFRPLASAGYAICTALPAFLMLAFVQPKPAHAEPQASSASDIESDEPKTVVFSSPHRTTVYQESEFKDEALLRLTNRVSARNRKITLKRGLTEAFDDLLITLLRCRATPITEKPNDSALIEVRRAPRKPTNWESTEKEPTHPVKSKEPNPEDSAELPVLFRGWIFSESPGLASPEHPVYTLRLLRCGKRQDPPTDEIEQSDNAK